MPYKGYQSHISLYTLRYKAILKSWLEGELWGGITQSQECR